jgi:hypothetical protein
MSELAELQKNIQTILEKLHLKFSSSGASELNHYQLINMIKDYSKIFNKYYLYPEDINFIKKHNRHPAKNIKRVKENLELLFLRMERETNSLLSNDLNSPVEPTHAVNQPQNQSLESYMPRAP